MFCIDEGETCFMSRFLEALAAEIKRQNFPIYRIAEIKDGGEAECMLLCPSNACQDSYSVAKAFTVTALGILFDQGRLKPEDRVSDFLQIPSGADPRWGRVTLDMVMRHRVGFSKNFLDIDMFDPHQFGDDYLAYLFAAPLECDPDTERVYSDAAYYLLACVTEAITGQPQDAFLWERLFAPLGFSQVAWSKCPRGHVIGGSGLYIQTNDMAKLGEVYRTGGLYHGRRILSKVWCDMVFDRSYELRRSEFGEAYRKSGMNGQMLMILPNEGRVVAWHGYSERSLAELEKWVCEYREA